MIERDNVRFKQKKVKKSSLLMASWIWGCAYRSIDAKLKDLRKIICDLLNLICFAQAWAGIQFSIHIQMNTDNDANAAEITKQLLIMNTAIIVHHVSKKRNMFVRR